MANALNDNSGKRWWKQGFVCGKSRR